MNHYVQILIDSLEKKKEVLNELIRLNAEQTEIIQMSPFDTNAFDENTDKKAEQIQALEKLDLGFDVNFQHCKDELLGHKEEYAEQIRYMQQLIRETIDLGSEVHAGGHRNKQLIEQQFKNERAQIKGNRTSSKAAYDYYRMMNKNTISDSMFLDHKK